MFCTFTTKDGTLILRTQDVRRLEDQRRGSDEPQCVVVWVEHEQCLEPQFRTVHGTATENLARLKAEELAMVAEAERHQQRQASGLPIVPVGRGRLR